MFYGWIILGGLSAIYFLGIGTVYYGFSVIIPEMIKDMGWSRAEASLGFSILGILVGMSGPLAAFCIGRFGVRTTMAGGGLMGVAATIFCYYMTSLTQYYIGIGLVGLSLSLLSVVPGLHLLANWFTRKRALAIGVYMSMSGAGAFFAAPMLALLVQTTGNWRDAWLVMGLALLFSTIVAAIVMRDSPQDMGTFPDGIDPALAAANKAEAAPQRVHQTVASFEVKDALRTLPYWMIIITSVVVTFGHGIVNSQAVLHMRDLGITPVIAASAIGIIGGLSAGGRLFTGILGDRFDPRFLLSIGLAMELIAMVMLIFASSPFMAYAFAVVFGAGNGMAIVAVPALLANYFGNKNYASLIGIRLLVVTPLASIGPILAGYTFDVTGSYTSVLLAFSAVALIPVLVILWMRPPAHKDLPAAIPVAAASD